MKFWVDVIALPFILLCVYGMWQKQPWVQEWPTFIALVAYVVFGFSFTVRDHLRRRAEKRESD